jgi:fused signal recognition particle receptor
MSLFKRLFNAIKSGSVSDNEWEEIRVSLIESDLGVKLTDELINMAKTTKPADAKEAIMAEVKKWLSKDDRTIKFTPGRTNTILVVGVNGTGKTTSTAKLAFHLKSEKKTILLAAADTFRAAAVEQLQTWADRIGVEVVHGESNADPASVAFSAITKAKEDQIDYLVVDTAGRLHNKVNLMEELSKVRRVAATGAGTVTEVLLVIDATTGQNGLVQAKQFTEAVELTGVVLTKLDGSAKGGIVIAIHDQLGIPVKLVGLGEGAEDLVPFDAAEFVEALFA